MSPFCFAAEPKFSQATTIFKVISPESKKAVKILVTSNQADTELIVKRGLPDKVCEQKKKEDQR